MSANKCVSTTQPVRLTQGVRLDRGLVLTVTVEGARTPEIEAFDFDTSVYHRWTSETASARVHHFQTSAGVAITVGDSPPGEVTIEVKLLGVWKATAHNALWKLIVGHSLRSAIDDDARPVITWWPALVALTWDDALEGATA